MTEKILKVIILISAGATVVCRYAAFKMSETLNAETVKILNITAYVGAAVLAICGIIYAIILKKGEKEQKNLEKDSSDRENDTKIP